jgi:23S rRNA pseudouridine2605 synthase
MRRPRAAPARRAAGAAARSRAAAGPERLQKVLAQAGLASRREAEAWIRAGRLTVNGSIATLGVRVAEGDDVRLDGRAVRQRPAAGGHVFLCHRSPGEPLAGSADSPGVAPQVRGALIERLPKRLGRRFIAVSPMPRIDGGLELVTSDGALAARLQRAVHALTSEFSVRVRGELDAAQLEGIAGGVLDSGAQLAVESCTAAGGEGSNRWYTLTARAASGKEIRQLFERQGALVSRVLRTRLGGIALERSLGRGRYRELTHEELASLLPGATPPGD